MMNDDTFLGLGKLWVILGDCSVVVSGVSQIFHSLGCYHCYYIWSNKI